MTNASIIFPSDLSHVFWWLVDFSVRGLLVVVVCLAIAMLLRNRSAALRHIIWVCGCGVLLFLPIVSAAVPKWPLIPQLVLADVNKADSANLTPKGSVPRLGNSFSGHTANQPELPVPAGRVDSLKPAVRHDTSSKSESVREAIVTNSWQQDPRVSEVAGRQRPPTSFIDWIVVVWMAGVALALVRIGRSYLVMRRLVVQATPLKNEQVSHLIDELAGPQATTRISVLNSKHRNAPLVTGIVRPHILLPVYWTNWDLRQLKSVLAHELAHVQRWDTLTQLICHAARAVHWFNPFVLFAASAARHECERACDDHVLAHGVKPSAYAEHLVAIATLGNGKSESSAVGVAMTASAGRLERRIRSVLGTHSDRRRVCRGVMFILVVSAATIAVPLATVGMTETQVANSAEDHDKATKRRNGASDPRPWINPRTGKRHTNMIFGYATIRDQSIAPGQSIHFRIRQGNQRTTGSSIIGENGAYAIRLREPLPAGSDIMIVHEGCVEFLEHNKKRANRLRRNIVFKRFTGKKSGVATTSSGSPIRGQVFFNKNTVSERTRQIDDNGVFHLDGIDSGPHDVTVRFLDAADGTKNERLTIRVADAQVWQQPKIRLDIDHTLKVVFDMPKGVLVGQGSLYWRVPGIDRTPERWGEATSPQHYQTRGSVVLTGLPDKGHFELVAFVRGRLSKQWQSFYGRAILDLAAVPDSRAFSLPMKRIEAVRVKVVDRKGKPVRHAVATTRPYLAPYRLNENGQEQTSRSGPPFAYTYKMLARQISSSLLVSHRNRDSREFRMGRIRGSDERMFVLSTAGGTVIEPGELAKLREGATIRVGSKQFLSGTASGVFMDKRGRIRTLEPFFYTVTLEGGAAIQGSTDRHGGFCIFLDGRSPVELELKSTQNRSYVKTIRNLQPGSPINLRALPRWILR